MGGLGYYSRVKNLQKAAKIIMSDYGGQFPGQYEQIAALPGIGAYTAGAVASICFGMPTPAVDGNVLRVLARITEEYEPVDTPAVKKRIAFAFGADLPGGGLRRLYAGAMELWRDGLPAKWYAFVRQLSGKGILYGVCERVAKRTAKAETRNGCAGWRNARCLF